MQDKHILLIVTGGIAAYKSLELIRLIKKNGGRVSSILTPSGSQFVTPLSISTLAEEECHTDLWVSAMDHINLSREADLIVIAPATANIIAKMAHGLADDLASTTLLAANKHILIAPAMNPQMWNNPATQANIKTLQARSDITILPPAQGDMACGETGTGRMQEASEIFAHIQSFFLNKPQLFCSSQKEAGKPLKGKTAIVTAGATIEPIDPVRFISNHSSGKQGYAIAGALHNAGASVTLISGPTNLQPPAGITTIQIKTADEMLRAAQNALPADIFIAAAAVSDWRAATPATQKIKKTLTTETINLENNRHSNESWDDKIEEKNITINFTENPDILKTIAAHANRPVLVIGFAAETENLIDNAKSKLKFKNCDIILANNVAENPVFGSDENQVHLITASTEEKWPRMNKRVVAEKLVHHIIKELEE
jgi:phosphopantothenoylcysteine decarboxylase/phosphopantothenate--cysteine ligase